MATVFGIVKNHKGYIYCYSEPGEGTTFSIYLPVSEKKVIIEDKKERIIKGNETILVVDDEKDILESAKMLLENLGYMVILAPDGKSALKIFKDRKEEIDIVLLDMIMPKMAGKETYLELKKIDPNVRVVLCSGYSQNGKATEILKEGVLAFIQKPFKLQELSEIISAALKKG